MDETSVPAEEKPQTRERVLSVDPEKDLTSDELLDRFLAYVESLGVELYPAQEEAILAITSGENVVLNTPTGSGKSLVARALHYVSFASGRRSVYTCPIKALVNEKFFELCETFGPEHVGMMTGDATVNPDAPILCATAEIVSNWALREGEETAIDDLVMDEFHYYADKERGVAWQIPLLTLRKTRMLLMSATMSDVEVFAERLTKLNGRPSKAVRSNDRPVPLEFIYKEIALHEVLSELVRESKIPAYVVCFTQRECSEVAQALTSLDWLSKDDKKKVAELLRETRFDTPYGKEVQRYLRAGLGIHHAGLLPKYRRAVERLAQTGLLRVICGTDTLGVGINVPIRTVVFTKLCKYDGEKTILLPVRDFKQIAGRAGRKGFDTHGTVIALAPEHVIENLKLEAKAGNDPAKKRKIVRRKPPERGYLPWDRTTFERLSTGEPEALQSRFAVSHSMVLEILQRGEGWKPLAYLLRDSHERHVDKRAHGRRAIALFHSLLDAGVVEQRETVAGFRFAVNPDLQREFSLHHTLSLFLYQALEKIDKTEPMYPLFLLSLVESIAENPEAILFRQVDVAKKLLIEDLKRQGVEYEARMEALEKVEHPKPDAGLIYDLFNAFAATHPWIGKENVRPKSIVREMFEGFYSFNDYVKEYELGRIEGLLLRYLSEVYKILVQTVPESARTSDVEDAIDYLGSVVRRVDATLIEEWESLRRVEAGGERVAPSAEPPEPASVSEKQLLVMVRNELFSYLRALRDESYGTLADGSEGQLTEGTLRKWFAGFTSEWGRLDLSVHARSAECFSVQKDSRERWIARQILRGEDGPSSYAMVLDVDVAASRKEGTLTLRALRLEPA